jgi:plasmid stabilization system protein ParE
VGDVRRCQQFLAVKSPAAAARAARTIDERLTSLKTAPDAGRSLLDMPGIREMVIPFGDSGYLALYRYVASQDTVYVLAIRHQKEAGY